MKFNKLFKILLVLIVLLVCLNAVAASDEMDSFGVGAEDGNLAVENNDISNALKSSDEDVLGDGTYSTIPVSMIMRHMVMELYTFLFHQ